VEGRRESEELTRAGISSILATESIEDTEKSNKIYRDGLKKVKDHNERKYLLERLESLEKMKKRGDKTKKS